MSRKATDWAWSQSIKPATDKLILLALSDRADENHQCFPSIKRLENDTSLNRKTIQAGIIRLMDAGFVSDTGERKGVTQRVRVLQLHINRSKIGNDTKTGIIPENGTLNGPENGTLNGPEIGTQNQSVEPVSEPIKESTANAGVIGGRSDRKKQQAKTQAKKPSKQQGFIDALINKGVDSDIAKEWSEVRKTKRATFTDGAINLIEREAGKAGISLPEAVQICALRGWQSLQADWVANMQKQHTGQNRQPDQPRKLQDFPMD